MRPLSLVAYRAALGALEPVVGLLLKRRLAAGKEDAQRLPERRGHASTPRPPGPLAILHAVSVGEAQSLLPLVQALKAMRPDLNLLVTSGTLTSARLLAERLPQGVIHQFSPVDTPQAVTRFLDHWRPDVLLSVESELWPNLLLGARERGVRLALLSARITEKSARGWARAPVAARAVLSTFDVVLPQDQASAQRLRALGASVGPDLNLKLVGAPLPCEPESLADLEAALQGRRVVLAASTHPGEDEIVLAAYQKAAAEGGLLIIAPRHVDRGGSIAELSAGLGLPTALRSRADALTPATQVYVADTMFEMGLFFRLADVVVMGGSFVPGIGGHNPLEPARIGRPIVSGPHAFNAADTYAEMYAEVAAIEAVDSHALARHVRGLLTQPLIAARMADAAQAYADRQQGALDRALELLAPLLPAARR